MSVKRRHYKQQRLSGIPSPPETPSSFVGFVSSGCTSTHCVAHRQCPHQAGCYWTGARKLRADHEKVCIANQVVALQTRILELEALNNEQAALIDKQAGELCAEVEKNVAFVKRIEELKEQMRTDRATIQRLLSGRYPSHQNYNSLISFSLWTTKTSDTDLYPQGALEFGETDFSLRGERESI